MASVLGLPRLKNNSQAILSCRLQLGFKPVSGQAVSAVKVDWSIYPLIMPFNGDFFGIVCEPRNYQGRCTVIRSGLSVAVLKDDLPDISPVDVTFFNLQNGYLTNSLGVAVGGKIAKLNEIVTKPKTGQYLNGALIDLKDASTLSGYDPQNDFNQLDFLTGDFA